MARCEEQDSGEDASVKWAIGPDDPSISVFPKVGSKLAKIVNEVYGAIRIPICKRKSGDSGPSQT